MASSLCGTEVVELRDTSHPRQENEDDNDKDNVVVALNCVLLTVVWENKSNQPRASYKPPPNIVSIADCLDKFGRNLTLLLADSSCNLLLLVAAKKELFSACKESPRDKFFIFMFGILLIIAHQYCRKAFQRALWNRDKQKIFHFC